jgi:hypothetical protein
MAPILSTGGWRLRIICMGRNYISLF